VNVISILASEQFAAIGVTVVVTGFSVFTKGLTLLLSKDRGKRPREWFYLGPDLAWASLGLTLARLAFIAQQVTAHQAAGQQIPADLIELSIRVPLYILLWLMLNLIIFALHFRFEFSEAEIQALGVAAEQQARVRRLSLWTCTVGATTFGIMTVVAHQVMLGS
jgi:predicted secreted protein